ncbi:hypothetical protein [Natranaerobius trueperi]|uniref:Uncharacterized protein n=1 Tax=Natranaerobius trueperi TaxID=759412 RepID=A0A226BZL6_9FIRM|nr:hypothetical protein [Natranaerobius trueperi]OWZ84385.1 hypothetical protein CDO51_03740 [Natranaerobius trueperi]
MKKTFILGLIILILITAGCSNQELEENIKLLEVNVNIFPDEDLGIFEKNEEGEVLSSIIPLNLNYSFKIKNISDKAIAESSDEYISYKLVPNSKLKDIFVEDKFSEKFEDPIPDIASLEPGDIEEINVGIAIDQELDGQILEHQDPDDYGPYIEEEWLKEENLDQLKELAYNSELHLYENGTKIQEISLGDHKSSLEPDREKKLTKQQVVNAIEDRRLKLDEIDKYEIEDPVDEDLPISPEIYKVGGKEDYLFVYLFDSTAERKEYFPMAYKVLPHQIDDFDHLFEKGLKVGSAYNALILLSHDETEGFDVRGLTRKLRDAIFYEIHDLNELTFQGDGQYWEVEADLEYYDYKWEDASGKDNQEFYGYISIELKYKGEELEDVSELGFRYSISETEQRGSGTTSREKNKETVLDENGTYTYNRHLEEPFIRDYIEMFIEWPKNEKKLILLKQ